ncbi:MAG: 5-formyltetrahydrofolate cyclo-ligase, 5-formyltetrahydrofolate cyclo-ligase [Deltaproteobacteria bacterium CSP1-8]|nr:MAG: 5-formyltetrahydrofolate cyclo-ligase, 5-formyltetrahydrofolate cyclo-ligase [Deltaproteobacteria bacterium CSP1-8]
MFVGDRKALLRLNERRRASPEDMDRERAGKNLRVQEIFLAAFPPASGRKIALYSAVRGEVGTDRIREQCLAAGVWLYYPRMCEDGNLTFFRHEENDGWERGRFGIREPQMGPGREGIRKGFDLVVVPGLAFDAAGRRLGQGHGYYDRFLSGLDGTAVTVGLAFSWQLVPEVPVDAWDVPVDAVVTENGVVERGIK